MKLAKKLLIEHLKALAEKGLTLAEAAKECGLGYSYVCTLSGAHEITFTRQRRAEQPRTCGRAQDMRQRYEDGETLELIGQRYGITRERVRQILTQRFGTTGRDGGQAELARRKRRALNKKRNERSLKVWGCKYSDYLRLLKTPGKPTHAYSRQRHNAVSRGIDWDITLWQWWKVWEASGHWGERGRGRGYGMCRHRDSGPYAVDNVYIATCVENIQDYWANRREQAAPVLEPAQ